MRRWLFVFVLLGLMVAVGCGLEIVSQYSAMVEEVAFRLVPAIFLIGSIVGLSMHRQV